MSLTNAISINALLKKGLNLLEVKRMGVDRNTKYSLTFFLFLILLKAGYRLNTYVESVGRNTLMNSLPYFVMLYFPLSSLINQFSRAYTI